MTTKASSRPEWMNKAGRILFYLFVFVIAATAWVAADYGFWWGIGAGYIAFLVGALFLAKVL